MAEDNADKSKKSLWIIIICAGVVIIGGALALLLKDAPVPISETDQRTEKTVATAEPAKTPASEQQPLTPSSKDSPSADKTAPPKGAGQPVVDYGKLKDDKELQAIMEKRKEKYGFEKGVDLIVKPDESVKVGDEVIPMKEILEKIRLERGEVIEKDITESTEPGSSTSKTIDEAVAAKKRDDRIEKLLKPSDKPPAEQDQTKEKKIEQIVSIYKEYKSTEEKIKEKKELLAALETKIKRLKQQKESPKAAQQTGEPKPDTYIPIKPGKQPASESVSKKAEPPQQSLVQKPVVRDKKQSKWAKLEPKKEQTQKPDAESISKKAESIQQPLVQIPVDQDKKQSPAAKLESKKEQIQKPDAYIPIKPGQEQIIPKVAPPTKESTLAALPTPPAAPKPKADQTAPKPQIIQKDRKVTRPKEKKKVLESVSPQTVQETAKPKKPEGGTAPIQKPVPSTKEMAKLEDYMKSIQDDINTLMLKKGDLESEIKQLLTEKEKPEAYGIYVVQNGDNIWNVHFAFLTEYFTSRGIVLSRTADEPGSGGKSSGVGKILKFSENMVYIYNTRDRRLELDINLIHPLSKIVVFNMGQVFELLDRLAYGDIEKIEFDGDNLWLPAES